MKTVTLADLQESVQDKTAFTTLGDYLKIGSTYLTFAARTHPTRIVSPSHPNYIFYQYGKEYGHKITRPLNSNLFIESPAALREMFERFMLFLVDLRKHQNGIASQESKRSYIDSQEINQIVYTVQQTIGSIADSFDNPNQSRKRAGQLFETLVKLIIQEVGVECEPRTINIP
ncbi:MAG: hypothetical protein AB1817_11155, partial [Chloroflexota bacterium]